jgi:SAM-dependent methyltransferase
MLPDSPFSNVIKSGLSVLKSVQFREAGGSASYEQPTVRFRHTTMNPVDIATQETLKFIERNCKVAGTNVLEVGCGKGELAKVLLDKGAKVTALDLSDIAVFSAKNKGVNAIQKNFFDYSGLEKFDAILFSRSLHHMQPVKDAVEKASALLKPNGVVLVEDFSVDIVDDKTLTWLRDRLAFFPKNILNKNAGEHHSFPVSSVDEWNEHHTVKHKVADTGVLIDSMKWSFSNVRYESAPYLYRYLVDKLASTDEAGEALRLSLESEKQAVLGRQIRQIGLRLVGVKD